MHAYCLEYVTGRLRFSSPYVGLSRTRCEFISDVYVSSPLAPEHAVWKVIRPLLDARTVNRVQWCEDSGSLLSTLDKWFTRDQIPDWLGGESTATKPDFLCGASSDPDILRERFASSENA